MSFLFRSTGLAPWSDDWLAKGWPPRTYLLRRARPGGKHDCFGFSRSAGESCARPGQARPGRTARRGLSLAGQSSPAGDKPRTWWNKNRINGAPGDQ
jgi:hypothetical protein